MSQNITTSISHNGHYSCKGAGPRPHWGYKVRVCLCAQKLCTVPLSIGICWASRISFFYNWPFTFSTENEMPHPQTLPRYHKGKEYLPESRWSETNRRMSPGSPSMLKQTVSLLKGKSTTKWGSPSTTGSKRKRKEKNMFWINTTLCYQMDHFFNHNQNAERIVFSVLNKENTQKCNNARKVMQLVHGEGRLTPSLLNSDEIVFPSYIRQLSLER